MSDVSLLQIHEFTAPDELIQAVNARDLHGFLELRRDFSTWITEMIKSFEFKEGPDFVKVFGSPNLGDQTGRGGNRKSTVDYFLTLDMAKELSMVQRNARGRQARQYFIDAEKRLRTLQAKPAFTVPQSMSEALRLAADEVERREEAERQLAIAAPKAEAFDRIEASSGSMPVTTAAKTLGLRPHDGFPMLQRLRWVFRRMGGKEWVAYQDKIDAGLLEHSVTTRTSSRGQTLTITQVCVTPAGLARLARHLGKTAQDLLL